MRVLKYLSKSVWLAMTIVVAATLIGCNDPKEVKNRAILVDANSIDNTGNSYQSGINDVGNFLRIFSEESWVIDVVYPDPNSQDWVMVSKTSGVGNGKVYISYARNADAARTVVINISFDSNKKTIMLTQLGMGGAGNQQQLEKWLEIPKTPATQSKSCWTISHFIPDRYGMRNFTVLYDTLQYYPLWVAYPIHNDYYAGTGRTDLWAFDPTVPSAYQPDMTRGMSNGYSRGHMLPSASRYVTQLANNQTFYFTNLSAQNSDFNSGVWAKLEGKVRNWGGYYSSNRNDTMYVVTGTVLKRVDITTDNVRKVNCRGKQIPVPNYYYKALLMKKGSGWKAIAWWYKHQYESEDRLVRASDAISIDELERRTGIDFFANLPENEQNAIERVEWTQTDWPL